MIERKQITKICKNCDNCGLPIITCICDKVKEVNTKSRFIILSNERETFRNTNTARILKLVNPISTEIVVWKRGQKHKEILKYLNNELYEVYLIFPTIDEYMKKRKVEYNNNNKIQVFIIIDGTWNEAWKIVRKSEYLDKLPIIAIDIKKTSKFVLRRGQEEGNLCTIETAIELLRMNKEEINANIIEGYFYMFLDSYKAGASGHKIHK